MISRRDRRYLYRRQPGLSFPSEASVSGIGISGQTLTLALGNQFTQRQWYHNGVAIPGATGSTYTVDADTDGGYLYCVANGVTSNAIHNFVPYSSSNAWAHWDANDFNLMTDTANELTSWTEKVGFAGTLLQGVGTIQPTINSRTLNGMHVIDFDGDDRLVASPYSLPSGGNFTFLLVAGVDAVNDSQDGMISFNSVSGTSDFTYRSGRATRFECEFVKTPEGNESQVGGNQNAPALHGGILNFTGGNFKTRYNGTSEPNETYSTIYDVSQTLRVMSNRSGADHIDGFVGDIVFLDTATISEVEKIERYLVNKFGLTSEYSGSTTADAADSTVAELTVNVTGTDLTGDDATTQFRRNKGSWTDVNPGLTGSSFTVSNVRVGDLIEVRSSGTNASDYPIKIQNRSNITLAGPPASSESTDLRRYYVAALSSSSASIDIDTRNDSGSGGVFLFGDDTEIEFGNGTPMEY